MSFRMAEPEVASRVEVAPFAPYVLVEKRGAESEPAFTKNAPEGAAPLAVAREPTLMKKPLLEGTCLRVVIREVISLYFYVEKNPAAKQ